MISALWPTGTKPCLRSPFPHFRTATVLEVVCTLKNMQELNHGTLFGGRTMTYTYNGLGLNLGNLSRVSNAESRSISAENFTGEKGKGGMATDGIGAAAARELGRGWKVSPCIDVPGNSTVTLANIRGFRCDPAALVYRGAQVLAGARAAYVLGQRRDAIGGGPAGRLLLHGLVRAGRHQVAAGCRQPGWRLQCVLGNALSPTRPDHNRKSDSRSDRRLFLPDQLHVDRSGNGARLFPCPVSPPEPAALQGSLHDPRRRPGAGPLCGCLYGLGCQQQSLVG